ncbi:MAG: DUF58 domain-containing protein [Comamonadaceae bacterium]|nr:DUF58 domain-containing protein [Comamonadaceae bacterium]
MQALLALHAAGRRGTGAPRPVAARRARRCSRAARAWALIARPPDACCPRTCRRVLPAVAGHRLRRRRARRRGAPQAQRAAARRPVSRSAADARRVARRRAAARVGGAGARALVLRRQAVDAPRRHARARAHLHPAHAPRPRGDRHAGCYDAARPRSTTALALGLVVTFLLTGLVARALHAHVPQPRRARRCGSPAARGRRSPAGGCAFTLGARRRRTRPRRASSSPRTARRRGRRRRRSTPVPATSIEADAPRRGRVRARPRHRLVGLSARPVARLGRTCTSPLEGIAYPAPEPGRRRCRRERTRTMPATRRSGRGDAELAGLREYQRGDPLQRVAWKAVRARRRLVHEGVRRRRRRRRTGVARLRDAAAIAAPPRRGCRPL